MTDLELWAIHAIAHYSGQPLDVVPPGPLTGQAHLVVEAIHKAERAGLIVRVEYKGAAWYELTPGINLKERLANDSQQTND